MSVAKVQNMLRMVLINVIVKDFNTRMVDNYFRRLIGINQQTVQISTRIDTIFMQIFNQIPSIEAHRIGEFVVLRLFTMFYANYRHGFTISIYNKGQKRYNHIFKMMNTAHLLEKLKNNQ